MHRTESEADPSLLFWGTPVSCLDLGVREAASLPSEVC